LILDSSTLISLSNSCLLKVMEFLARKGARFEIPQSVREESITRPLQLRSRAHDLSALSIQRLIDREVITVSEANGNNLMDLANHVFYVKGRPIHLVDKGEADALALAVDVKDYLVGIDERTTTSLIENPMGLKEHLEKEFRTHVMFNEENYNAFVAKVGKIGVVRSSELVAFAYEQGFFNEWRDKRRVLLASLYRLKYNGCGITFKELDEYHNLF